MVVKDKRGKEIEIGAHVRLPNGTIGRVGNVQLRVEMPNQQPEQWWYPINMEVVPDLWAAAKALLEALPLVFSLSPEKYVAGTDSRTIMDRADDLRAALEADGTIKAEAK